MKQMMTWIVLALLAFNAQAQNIDQVQGALSSLAIKAPVKAATTGAITLNSAQTIDGISVVTGDRVLVKDQSDAADNGIYVVNSTSAWRRAPDWDGNRDMTNGTLVHVVNGNTQANDFFQVTVESPPVIDSSTMVFTGIPIATGDISTTQGSFINISATNISATYLSGDGSGITGITWSSLGSIPANVQAVSNSGAVSLTSLALISPTSTISMTGTGAVAHIRTVSATNISASSIGNASTQISGTGIGLADAWGIFNGQTGSAIRTYNIGSITRGGEGSYTIVISPTMPDANYAVVAMGNSASGTRNGIAGTTSASPTASTFYLTSFNSNTGSPSDSDIIWFIVFGNR